VEAGAALAGVERQAGAFLETWAMHEPWAPLHLEWWTLLSMLLSCANMMLMLSLFSVQV
jgi:hypothetical protein